VEPKQITGDMVVAKAREYIGTPWHHAARCKGVGIDCIGLFVCVGQELGLQIIDVVNYSMGSQLNRMLDELDPYVIDVDLKDVRTGDLMVFSGKMMPNHCGIYSGEDTLIHAWRTVGKVVEMPLDEYWMNNLFGVFRIKESI